MKPAAPSGIAQLRRSVDALTESPSDPMNLDDFIQSNVVASPAGITSPISTEASQRRPTQPGPGIPITTKAKPQIQVPRNLPAASVPKSSIALNRSGEFDYVQKRVRKTSIDERTRVSIAGRYTSFKAADRFSEPEKASRFLTSSATSDRTFEWRQWRPRHRNA